MSGLLDRRREERIEHAAIRLVHKRAHLVARRPSRRLRRRVLGVWIDAAREQPLEAGIDPRFGERPRDERIETEGREVAFIENDGMSKGDRPGVIRIRCQEIEEPP